MNEWITGIRQCLSRKGLLIGAEILIPEASNSFFEAATLVQVARPF
jgi:hypothetical protein